MFQEAQKHNCVATETEKVLLYDQLPPIVKMDNKLGTLNADERKERERVYNRVQEPTAIG